MAREEARVRAIDRQLARLRDRYLRVCARWEKVKLERRVLDAAATSLLEEREALTQGQLMLRYRPRRYKNSSKTSR